MYSTIVTTVRRVSGTLSRITTENYLFESYNDALIAYNHEMDNPPEYREGVTREVSIILLPDDLTDTATPVTLTVAR